MASGTKGRWSCGISARPRPPSTRASCCRSGRWGARAKSWVDRSERARIEAFVVLAPWVVVFLIRFRAGGRVVAPVQFWFEFASTYSYVAALRIEAVAWSRGVPFEWKPFLLGPIFRR